MEERCNQIMDCKDKSDENNCKLIVFEENYNKNVPPFSISTDDQSLVPARVTVSTQLENVLAISEFSHTIDLKLSITLEWYENRVVYYNLKSKEALNILTKSEVTNSISNIIRVYMIVLQLLRLRVCGSHTLYSRILTTMMA